MGWLEKYLRMQVPYMLMVELTIFVKDETIENFMRLNHLSSYEICDVINIIKNYDYDKELNFIKEEQIKIGNKFKSGFNNNVFEIVDTVNEKLILKCKNEIMFIDKNKFRKYLLKEVKQ